MKKKLSQLEELKENEKIYLGMLRHYDVAEINAELKILWDKIETLTGQRDEVIEKRLNVCQKQTAFYENKLKKNKMKQLELSTSHKLMIKLAKAVNAVKEIEELIEV